MDSGVTSLMFNTMFMLFFQAYMYLLLDNINQRYIYLITLYTRKKKYLGILAVIILLNDAEWRAYKYYVSFSSFRRSK